MWKWPLLNLSVCNFSCKSVRMAKGIINGSECIHQFTIYSISNKTENIILHKVGNSPDFPKHKEAYCEGLVKGQWIENRGSFHWCYFAWVYATTTVTSPVEHFVAGKFLFQSYYIYHVNFVILFYSLYIIMEIWNQVDCSEYYQILLEPFKIKVL